jgi:hypothetical protein
MSDPISFPPLNRKALISFLAGVLALCAGFLPVLLTAVLCYPPGLS